MRFRPETSNLKSARPICLAFVLTAGVLVGCSKSDEATSGKASPATQSAPPASVATATGGDYPAFHNGGPLDGVAAPIGGGQGLRVRWTFKAEDELEPATQASTQPAEPGARPAFESSAAIVGGTVYAANKAGQLIAINLGTGKRKWMYKSEAPFSAGPAVLKGVVYIGDEDGIFHAVNTATGRKAWTFDAGSGIHSSANFLGDRIVFGDDGADIFCLNATDGKQIWNDKAGDRVNGSPAIGGSPPSAYVSGCDAQLRALTMSDGKERFAHDMGALCPGSPAIVAGRVVVGTDGGKVVCYAEDGQKQLWAFEGVSDGAMVYSSPAVSDGIVVVGARDRNVYGLDLSTGKKLWSFPTRGEVDSSPAISSGRVYVGSKDKRLYVLDLYTGKKLADFVAGRGITATPAIGQGVVVIGDTGGNLYCLEPETE
jgi:eukaryotic-like serine/threonine-protein kinase